MQGFCFVMTFYLPNMSSAYIQMLYREFFMVKANIMNHDHTAPKAFKNQKSLREQSDLGPYYLQ